MSDVIGFVEWYDKRGYGLIVSCVPIEGGKKEFFLHCSNMLTGDNVAAGDMLFFRPGIDEKRHRCIALDVKPFSGTLAEWHSVLEHVHLSSDIDKRIMHAALLSEQPNGKCFVEQMQIQQHVFTLDQIRYYGQILCDRQIAYMQHVFACLGEQYLILVNDSEARIKDWQNQSIPISWLTDEDIQTLIMRLCGGQERQLMTHPHWPVIIVSFVQKQIVERELNTVDEIALINEWIGYVQDETMRNALKAAAVSKMDATVIAQKWLTKYVPNESEQYYCEELRQCFYLHGQICNLVPADCLSLIKTTLIRLSYQHIKSVSILLSFIDNGFLPDLGAYLDDDANLKNITVGDLSKLNEKKYISREFYIAILERLFSMRLFVLCLKGVSLLKERAIAEDFTSRVQKQANEQEYFNLWCEQCVSAIPYHTIVRGVLDGHISFASIETWIEQRGFSLSVFREILQPLLDNLDICESRTTFNFVKSYSQFLIHQGISAPELETLEHYPLIKWLNNITSDNLFDVNNLKGCFAVLSHADQRIVLKRLFYLKAIGVFDFTVQSLRVLLASGYKTLKDKESFRNESIWDFSTILVLGALKKYSESGSFPTENDLYRIFKDIVNINSTERPSIGFYFDECEGLREVYVVPPCGNILHQGGNYVICLKQYDVWVVDSLKQQFKNRRYDPKQRAWLVPDSDVDNVISFAQQHHFSIDGARVYCLYETARNKGILPIPYLQGHIKQYLTNHLPAFCEGIKAKKRYYGYEYWVCRQMRCFESCRTLHGPEQWEKYTLLDFLSILKYDSIGLMQTTSVGNIIEDGKYLQFVGFVNRFKEVLKHMYCRSCGKVMLPIETSNYNAYAVTQFACYDPKCDNYGQPVYINHCMNRDCLAIIDSRDTKECSNHWRICPQCASCCDADMARRGLEKAQLAGGYVAAKWQQTLQHPHNPNEYYCPICGIKMEPYYEDTINTGHENTMGICHETMKQLFRCPSCVAIYERRTSALDRSKVVKGLQKLSSPSGHIDNKVMEMPQLRDESM